MMATILPHSIFLHVPKTGGSWVRKVVKRLMIPHSETGDLWPQAPDGTGAHHTLHDVRQFNSSRFKFCFVRDPVTWYRSFWCYWQLRKLRHGPTTAAWDPYLDKPFRDFVSACIDNIPGQLSKLYEQFTGWPVEVDYVGRYEYLEADLLLSLGRAREYVDPSVVFDTQRLNAAASLPEWSPRCQYTPELKTCLQQAEWEVYRRYYGGTAV